MKHTVADNRVLGPCACRVLLPDLGIKRAITYQEAQNGGQQGSGPWCTRGSVARLLCWVNERLLDLGSEKKHD